VRYHEVPGYHAAIFRRSLPQIRNSGGQWDKSYDLYPHLGARPHRTDLRWTLPSGATIRFWHLINDQSWLDWQGTETAFFGFDQLEEFTQTQFLKILGCNRTTAKAPTQIMATMNPDAGSWVRQFVDPWIAEDGYVDPQQNGRIKHFTVDDDQIIWVDKTFRDANNQPPISVVYLSADVWDNPALLQADPNYLSNLMAQGLVDRERFLGIKGRGGNWNIKPEAGKVFRAEWFAVQPSRPAYTQAVRFWDFASTEKAIAGKDPDYTASVLMLQTNTGYVIADAMRFRGSPAQVDTAIANMAMQDGPGVMVRWWQDPGQAGAAQSYHLQEKLRNFNALGVVSNQDKYTRAKPLSRAVEFSQVSLVQGHWHREFIDELVQFPDGAHDDFVDAAAGAYSTLAIAQSTSTGTLKT
jgi:predicted phage terminase large subunit-like protein